MKRFRLTWIWFLHKRHVFLLKHFTGGGDVGDGDADVTWERRWVLVPGRSSLPEPQHPDRSPAAACSRCGATGSDPALSPSCCHTEMKALIVGVGATVASPRRLTASAPTSLGGKTSTPSSLWGQQGCPTFPRNPGSRAWIAWTGSRSSAGGWETEEAALIQNITEETARD